MKKRIVAFVLTLVVVFSLSVTAFADSGTPAPGSWEEKTLAKLAAEVFSDVKADAYYASAVGWAVSTGITNGTDKTHFSPDANCTRGQIITFLWRLAGSDASYGAAMSLVYDKMDNKFEDVKKNDYYFNAVAWAVALGITNGTDASHFSPNATCTRAQIVTFMQRLASKAKVIKFKNPTGQTPNVNFADVNKTDYFYNAVQWAVKLGITNGTDAKHFSPDSYCTRGQAVTFMYRFMQSVDSVDFSSLK